MKSSINENRLKMSHFVKPKCTLFRTVYRIMQWPKRSNTELLGLSASLKGNFNDPQSSHRLENIKTKISPFQDDLNFLLFHFRTI